MNLLYRFHSNLTFELLPLFEFKGKKNVDLERGTEYSNLTDLHLLQKELETQRWRWVLNSQLLSYRGNQMNLSAGERERDFKKTK